MVNVKESLALLCAFVAGVVAGGAAGLLLAPASGPQTRRRMAQRYDDEKRELLRKAQRVAEGAADRLEHGLEDGKRRLSAALRS